MEPSTISLLCDCSDLLSLLHPRKGFDSFSAAAQIATPIAASASCTPNGDAAYPMHTH